MDLVGKVVRLHSKSQPNKYNLYMVIDAECDSYSNGQVTIKTVNKWSKNGLDVTVYAEI